MQKKSKKSINVEGGIFMCRVEFFKIGTRDFKFIREMRLNNTTQNNISNGQKFELHIRAFNPKFLQLKYSCEEGTQLKTKSLLVNDILSCLLMLGAISLLSEASL